MTMEHGASQPRRNGDGRWKAVVSEEETNEDGETEKDGETDKDGEINEDEESDELKEDGASGETEDRMVDVDFK